MKSKKQIAGIKGKQNSPWSKGPNCSSPKAWLSYKNLIKNNG